MASNPWLNYHHLYYFKTIAEEGSVSGAAAKLSLGQPTLSAQLKQFEETIGIELFERRHKKLVLTEQGKVALEYAATIFKTGSEMLEVLHDRMKPAKPALCIGSLDNIAKQIVLRLVRAALRSSPCHITLVEGPPDELLRELAAHRVDLLLTNFVPADAGAKGLQRRLVARSEVSFYAAPKFKGLRRGFPKSISGAPMILPTYDSKVRYDIDHWANLQGVEFDIAIESQDVSTNILTATNELGLLPAAPHAVADLVRSGALIEIGRLDSVVEELYLVAAKRKIENKLAMELMREFAV